MHTSARARALHGVKYKREEKKEAGEEDAGKKKVDGKKENKTAHEA